MWFFLLNIYSMSALHESVAKETAEGLIIKLSVLNNKTVSLLKWTNFLLIGAGNEASNVLLASFPTKNSENLVIFTHHLICVKVSLYL